MAARRQAVWQQGISYVYTPIVNLLPTYSDGDDVLVRFNKKDCVKHLFRCETSICKEQVQIKVQPTQCIDGQDDYLLEVLALDKTKLSEIKINVLPKKIYK